MCANCTIWRQYLGFAVEDDEPFGVWGGMSKHERRVLIKFEINLTSFKTPDELRKNLKVKKIELPVHDEDDEIAV